MIKGRLFVHNFLLFFNFSITIQKWVYFVYLKYFSFFAFCIRKHFNFLNVLYFTFLRLKRFQYFPSLIFIFESVSNFLEGFTF